MQNVGQNEKMYYRGSNMKKENSEFESFVLKIILNFDDIIKREDFDFYNTLIDWRYCKSILIFTILHRTLIGLKPLGIRFDKIDGLIKVYDGTRYLVLFLPEKYDAIYNRIRYLISRKKWYFIRYFSKLSKN